MARAWLRDHPAAQVDELAELKDANPSAYALVKALLTKRSLGLLDPRHPSASFATHGPSEQPEVSGADAFAKFSNSVTPPVAESMASQPTLAHQESKRHDWLNWRPASTAADDEALVRSVMGEGDVQSATAASVVPLDHTAEAGVSTAVVDTKKNVQKDALGSWLGLDIKKQEAPTEKPKEASMIASAVHTGVQSVSRPPPIAANTYLDQLQ